MVRVVIPPDCFCEPEPNNSQTNSGTNNGTNSGTNGTNGTNNTGGGTSSTFRDLSDDPLDPDDEDLAPGSLTGFPGGLRALAGDDTVNGSTADELINGNRGQDSLLGAEGQDTLRGGRDSDRVFGENGNDVVNGNKDNDIVLGGDGNDIVRGGQGNDLIVGGEDDDTLIGDFGLDMLVGGEDDDLFVLRTGASGSDSLGADLILDFNASDDDIGLTEGVTFNNLEFQEVSLDLTSQLTVLAIFGNADIATLSGINTAALDPDGDGTVRGTLIQIDPDDEIQGRGNYLGFVVNATESDLSRQRFVEAVPDSVLGQG
ncbi:MAG: calcium-binding protein [Oscillatoria sp. SIO1A7]|nr:calcium-binding protein [Oscillatoria sp. SIO1A7]